MASRPNPMIEQFALTEISYVTVRLLQRFDKMEDMETERAIKYQLAITMRSAQGVKVKLHEASE